MIFQHCTSQFFVRLMVLAFLFLGICGPHLIAEETPSSSEEVISEEASASQESKVFQPKDVKEGWYERRSSGSSLAWAVYLFMFMVAVILGLWLYQRQGGLKMNRLGLSNDLKIRETKPLGNKQFLVVVEYGEQKMLLGIAPGVINHLCYLESSDIASKLEEPHL